MTGIGYTCAIMLSGVFAVAALAKLRRPSETASSFAELGVPGRVVPLVAGWEGVLSIGLLILPRWMAPAAGLSLVAFSAVLLAGLRRGVRARCGCFGTAGRNPLSLADVARTMLLAVLAIAASFSTTPVVGPIESIVLVSTGFLAGWVVLGLVRLRIEVGAVWDNTLAGSILADEL